MSERGNQAELERILALAEHVLGDRERADRWLTSASRALGGEIPLQLLETHVGAQRVEQDCTRSNTASLRERVSQRPSSEALEAHRDQIRRIVAQHRATNRRVFGSVLHGCDHADSDLDLLVDPTDETTVFDLGAISGELEDLLGVPVDVLTPKALPAHSREKILAEAWPV